MFDMYFCGLKNAKKMYTNISYLHYRTLEPVPFLAKITDHWYLQKLPSKYKQEYILLV